MTAEDDRPQVEVRPLTSLSAAEQSPSLQQSLQVSKGAVACPEPHALPMEAKDREPIRKDLQMGTDKNSIFSMTQILSVSSAEVG